MTDDQWAELMPYADKLEEAIAAEYEASQPHYGGDRLDRYRRQAETSAARLAYDAALYRIVIKQETPR